MHSHMKKASSGKQYEVHCQLMRNDSLRKQSYIMNLFSLHESFTCRLLDNTISSSIRCLVVVLK